MQIRDATASDLEALKTLLESSHLSTAHVLEPGTRYWVAEREGVLIGAIGLELGDGVVLLRSAVTHPEHRGSGLGSGLTHHALAWARGAGFRLAYLFSTGAGAFWARQGFREVPVDELVSVMPDAPQVGYYRQNGWLPSEVAWRKDFRVLVGDRLERSLTLSREDISSFARLAGDLNPVHHDFEYAKTTQFGELIASGTHTVPLLMGMVPTHFSRLHQTVGLEFNFKFKRAVKALEPLTLGWRVTAVTFKASLKGELVVLEGAIRDGAGEVLLEGRGTILITDQL